MVISSSLSSCYLSAAAAEPRSSFWALRGWSAINYPRQVSSFNYVKYNNNNNNNNNNNRGLLLSSKFTNPDDRFYRLRMSSICTNLHFIRMCKNFGPENKSKIDPDVKRWIYSMLTHIYILYNFLFTICVKVSRMLAPIMTVLVFAIMAAALSPSFARTRAASIIHSNSSYSLRPCIQCTCSSNNYNSQFLQSSPPLCTCNCHIPRKCTRHFLVELIPNPIILVVFFLTIQRNIKKSMDSKDLDDDERCGTLFFLQIAILDKNRNLQRKINNIAGSGNTHSCIGLNYVLKEVVKTLLQHQDSCHSAYRYARYDNMESFSKPCFKFFLKSGLQRYDKNEKTSVNELKCKKEFIGEVDKIDNEYSVVTLIVLAWGECWIPNWHTANVKMVDIKTTLQLIGYISENNLEAAKVLCTQQTENYGHLMRPVSVI